MAMIIHATGCIRGAAQVCINEHSEAVLLSLLPVLLLAIARAVELATAPRVEDTAAAALELEALTVAVLEGALLKSPVLEPGLPAVLGGTYPVAPARLRVDGQEAGTRASQTYMLDIMPRSS